MTSNLFNSLHPFSLHLCVLQQLTCERNYTAAGITCSCSLSSFQQKKLAYSLSFTEHVPALSVKSRFETQPNGACGVPVGWIKFLFTDERRRTVDTDLWAYGDRCGSFWFILSRIPPGLLATRTEELEALQQRGETNGFNRALLPWNCFPWKKLWRRMWLWALHCMVNGLHLYNACIQRA